MSEAQTCSRSFMELSSSQIISVPIFVVAGWLYLRGWLRARRRAADSATPAPS